MLEVMGCTCEVAVPAMIGAASVSQGSLKQVLQKLFQRQFIGQSSLVPFCWPGGLVCASV